MRSWRHALEKLVRHRTDDTKPNRDAVETEKAERPASSPSDRHETPVRSRKSVNRHTIPIITPKRAAAAPGLDRRQETAAAYPAGVEAPAGAPNVLLIILDDVGFGASSAFGGPCDMPTADALAQSGLRYTRFHTTSMCSPTRASLLTGRNHHVCGMGAIPELATQAPGYTGMRPPSVATIARMLQGNGYATAAFGKMHQTPPWETTPAGPHDRWPTREGFDRFYGFLGSETNHFAPTLVEGTTPIDPPKTAEEGYHLSEDLADQAITWIDTIDALDADRPWFCYLSFGATHAPLQVPEDWRDRYRGQFAQGWDEQRQRTFAAQKALGVIPEDAQLPAWPVEVPRWQDLTDTERAVCERLMETYAAFLEHTDVQTGRVIDRLRDLGVLGNTLVLYLVGDNGASAEGGFHGSLNEYLGSNGLTDTAERIHEHLELIGGPDSYVHYPAAWALAMDTPYQWAKSVASHYGGTRNGLIVRWDDHIRTPGGLRHQWHHCIDVGPTILEAAGLPEPTEVDGVPQVPMDGTSFLHTLNDPDAPDRHTTQYFEMMGNRGIYHCGWTAVTKHRDLWSNVDSSKLPAFKDDSWELYDTTSDWTQARDVAADHPEKLHELQQRFLIEAARFDVLPLDDRFNERHDAATAGRPVRRSITLRQGMPGIKEGAAPNVKNTSFHVRADLTLEKPSADGVIVAQGGRFGGWVIYLLAGRLCYCHNFCGLDRYYVRSEHPIEAGRHQIDLAFHYDGGGLGKGGDAWLHVDGTEAAIGRIPRTTPYLFSLDETLDVGLDRATPVADEYGSAPGNAIRGTIHEVRITTSVEEAIEIPEEVPSRIALRRH